MLCPDPAKKISSTDLRVLRKKITFSKFFFVCVEEKITFLKYFLKCYTKISRTRELDFRTSKVRVVTLKDGNIFGGKIWVVCVCFKLLAFSYPEVNLSL